MSCREVCRRVFRGILVIPGCKTICYKCILPPCYSNCDSDDEKEDKDDEGYDSCGNAASESHIPEATESNSTAPAQSSRLDNSVHDYVNQADYTNVNPADPVSKSTENLYVQMKLESTEHLRLITKNSSSTGRHIRNAEGIDTSDSLETDSSVHSYVNTDKAGNFCFKKTVDCSPRAKRTYLDDILNSDRCVPKSNVNEKQDNESIELKCERSPVLSAKDISVPSRSSTIDSPTNKQTLVLLETDL